jgi:uncharacterized repeat protein (TIGR01451 family)
LTLTGSYNTSGSKTNTAFLSGFTGTTETGVQSNTGTTTGIVWYTPSFDFGLTKSGFSTASSGELVSYTLIATNYGPDTAFDIIVADTLPVDFSISDSGTTQGTRDGSSRSIGTLTPGQTVTLTLTGSYNTSGSKTNTAFLSGFTGATETGVQSNTGTTTGIVWYTPSFDFGLTKSGFSTASSGELVSYTLIATNYGPDTAFDIIVADTLPVDFSVSDSGTTQGTRDGSSRSIGTLTPGQTVTLTLTGSYNTSGSKTNTAFLSGFTGATETGVQSNTGTTTGIVWYTPSFDFGITKSGFSTASSGELVSYTLIATNYGPDTAFDIIVADTLPVDFSVSDSGTTQGTRDGSSRSIGTLTPGQTVTLTLTGSYNTSGSKTNTAFLSGFTGATETGVQSNTGTTTGIVWYTPSFDFGLTKSGFSTASSGELVSYTLIATNYGPDTAFDIIVADTLPVDFSVSDSGTTQGTRDGSSRSIGTLTPGQTVTLTLTGSYNTSGSKTNTAFLSGFTGATETGVQSNTGTTTGIVWYTPSFDFGLTKSGFSTASSGELVSYTLIATNYGPDTAFDIIVADTLPVDFSISDSGTTQGTRDGSSRSIGTLTPGQTVTLTLTGSYNTSGSKTNTAFLSGFTGTTETGVQSNTGTTTGIVWYTPSFDFGLTKSGFSTASSGELVSYTLIATNYGPDTAFDIIVADTLPVDFSISDSGTTQGTRDGSSRSIGTLTPGQTVTLTLTGSYNTSGSKTNTAFLSGFTGATETGVQSNTGTTTGIVWYTPSFDFGLTKSGFSTASSGELVSYTLIATNYGPDTAFDIIVADTLPVDFSVSDSGTTQGTRDGSSRSIGTLTPGQTVTLTLTGSYNTSGSKTNTAFLSGFTGATETGVQSNTGTTTGIVWYTPSFDFGITKSGFSTASSGELVSYTLIATNYGPDTAFDIIVADTLPVDFSVSDSGTTQGTRDGSSRSIGTLTPGQTVTLTLTGSYNTSGSKTNTAFLSGFTGATETGVQSNTGTTTGIVWYTPSFDFGLTKSGFSTASSGELVSYTLIATNYGPDTAFDIIVADTLPVDFSVSDSGTTQGTRDGSSRSIGTLTPGQTVTLTLTGSYNTSGSKTNTAFLSGFTGATETGVQSNTGTTTGIVWYTPSFDFGLTKSGFSTASSGELVSYTLIATNYGPDTAFDIIVADTLPVDFSVSDSGTTQGTRDGSSRSIGTLTPGQTVTLTLTGSYNTSGSKTNTAFLSGFTGATETGVQSNTGTTTGIVWYTPSFDFGLTKSGFSTASSGELVSYTLIATNYGPDTAFDIIVADTLPVDFSVSDSGTTQGTRDGSSRSIGTLTPGQTVTLTLTGSYNTSGSKTNTAFLSGFTGATETGVQSNTGTTTGIVWYTPSFDFGLTKSGFSTASSGELVSYTLIATNYGPDTAFDIIVADTLPVDFSVSDSGTTQGTRDGSSRSIGTLTPGQTVTLTLTGSYNTSGSKTNTAFLSGFTGATETGVQSNIGTTTGIVWYTPSFDFGLTKSGFSTASSGELVSYTLIATNYGPDTAFDIIVADTLPVDFSVSDSGTTQGTRDGSSRSIGTLTPGQTVTLTLTGSYNTSGSKTNTAFLSGFTGATETGVQSNTGTTTDTVTQSWYDLRTYKVVSTDTANLGDQITYTIVYGNYGPNLATWVVVQDVFPSDVLNFDSSNPVYDAFSGSIYARDVWPLAPWQTAMVVLTATVIDIPSGWVISNMSLVGKNISGLTDTLWYDDLDAYNNIDTVTWNAYFVDLAVDKTVDQNIIMSGDTVTYTIYYSNDWTTGASGVLIYDILPAWFTYLSSDPSGVYDSSTWWSDIYVWNIGSLNPGSSGMIVVTWIAVGLSWDLVENVALIESNSIEEQTGNNVVLVSSVITAIPTSDFTGTVLLTGSDDPVSWLLLTVYSGTDPITSGFTNASGQLIITGLPVWSYTYSYDPADLLVLGYIPAWNTTGPNNTTLYVVVPISDFTGTVLLTGSDDPVSWLLLTVYSGTDPITSGFTNASGQLIITGLPVWSYTYSYDPADLLVLGYIPAWNTTGPNNTTLYVVVPTSDFTGTVLLTGSDDPVSWLLLTVYSGTDPITSGFTNASGQLIITGLPVWSYTYSYDPADLLVLGYIPAWNTTGPNNTTLYVVVPTSDFTGTVLLTGSDDPVSWLLLTVYSGTDPITSGFTNASGQLIITGLPVWSYTYSYDPADLLVLGYIPAWNTTGPNNTTLYVSSTYLRLHRYCPPYW